MIRRPPRSTQSRSSAASDVYKRQIPRHALLTLIQALVVSKVDYCNSVLAGVSDSQSVLNAAARLVFSARRSEHITPLLRELHWLRVPGTGGRNWKRTISKGPSSCSWNDQCRRVGRSQAAAGTAARCQLRGLGEVPWHCTMKASEGQNTEPKLYPLWNSQPVEFTE